MKRNRHIFWIINLMQPPLSESRYPGGKVYGTATDIYPLDISNPYRLDIPYAFCMCQAINVIMSKFNILHPENSLLKASRHVLNSHEKSFVVVENDKVVGILDYKNIIDDLHEGKTNQKVEAFMRKDFRWFENEDYLSDKFFQVNQSLYPVMQKGRCYQPGKYQCLDSGKTLCV